MKESSGSSKISPVMTYYETNTVCILVLNSAVSCICMYTVANQPYKKCSRGVWWHLLSKKVIRVLNKSTISLHIRCLCVNVAIFVNTKNQALNLFTI